MGGIRQRSEFAMLLLSLNTLVAYQNFSTTDLYFVFFSEQFRFMLQIKAC